jgi:predicted RNase H-like nuclease (RuvC/YqgF family)
LDEKIRQLLDENEPINILADFAKRKYGTLVAAIRIISEDYENAVKYSNLNTVTDDPTQLENPQPGRGKTTYSKVLTRMKELLREKGKSGDIAQMEQLELELKASRLQFEQLRDRKDKIIRETNEKLQDLQKAHKDAMEHIESLSAENANLKTLNKLLSDQNVKTEREMVQLLEEQKRLTAELIAVRKSPKKAPESDQIRLRLSELTRSCILTIKGSITDTTLFCKI